MFASDIGIDLGTANVLVYVKGKGIVMREPSVVAIDQNTNKILSVGEEARQMIGRTPGHIVAVRPLKDGVIANYDVTEAMLKYFIHKVYGRHRILRPRVVVCAPSGGTSVETRAILEACAEAGGKKVYIISEPMAAAIGAGLDITQASGSMVVDIGGGTTDVAVISLGGDVVTDSIKTGGDKLDEAISRYAKKAHNLAIGDRTAEEIKVTIGRACPDYQPAAMEVRGRDLVSGLPRTIELTSQEISECIQEQILAIVDMVRAVLEKTPPELSADIIEKGIVLTGGGALLTGLDLLIQKETGIRTIVAEDPMSCVALGIGMFLESLSKWPDNIIVASRTA